MKTTALVIRSQPLPKLLKVGPAKRRGKRGLAGSTRKAVHVRHHS